MLVMETAKEFLFAGDLQERYLIKYSSIPLSTIVLYVVFVKWWGPHLMKNRKPFDLKYAMIAYNFIQCFANAYIVHQLVQFNMKYWYGRCLAKRNPVFPTALVEIYQIAWILYLIKFSDLIDTVFFVLRKKDSHITFLHVFHHSMTCLMSCWFIRSLLSLGFYVCLGLTINTAVHVIMYFYYGLAAFGPGMRKYLWWKRYLTQLQIAQFLFMLVYMLAGFVTGCEEMGFVEITSFVFVLLICVLFINFYRKDRQRRQQQGQAANGIIHHKEKLK